MGLTVAGVGWGGAGVHLENKKKELNAKGRLRGRRVRRGCGAHKRPLLEGGVKLGSVFRVLGDFTSAPGVWSVR